MALKELPSRVILEKRMLKRIFVPKRDDEAGVWKKVRNKERHNLYSGGRVVVKALSYKPEERGFDTR
jgi:hypothetical protein